MNGKKTSGTGPFGELIFSNNNDSVATVAGFRDGADNKGSLVFQTQDGSNGFGTRLTINSAGAATFTGTTYAPFIGSNNANGAGNGVAQEMARFVNMGTGATSSYMYIGASSGTDWRLGKNILGTASNTNFGIAKHSGTVLALEIDGSNNATFAGNLSAKKLTSTDGVLELDDNGTHNGIINVPASLRINIDSDNSNTGESFQVANNATNIDNNNILFKVEESGNATFTGNVAVNNLALPDGHDIGWDGGFSSSKPTLAANGTTMKMYPSGNAASAQFTLSPTQATFEGDVVVNKQIVGVRKNHMTTEGWTTGGFNMTGYFGGDFTGSEASNAYREGPYGTRELVQETVPDSNNDFDGGWNKSITNLDINKAYMSIVYVKRVTSQTSGNFYHGTGAGTNQIFNLNGTSNTNPYFVSVNIGTLPQDVWCVSIGYIQANNDSNTSEWEQRGIYRLDTGEQIYQGATYKMGSAGATLSTGHRVFLYYSSDNTSKLQFARPGHYEMNGHHPTINELVNPGGFARQGDTETRTFAGDVRIPQGAFIASQTSTTNPVARFTNTDVNNYDFTFPNNSTLQLGSSVDSDLILKLSNAGTGGFNLNVVGDGTFTGVKSTGNALSVNRGSDSANVFRVQNTGEVVVTNNYFYAAGAGTSMYVQNTAVFRGSIVNDAAAGVVIADDLTVNDDLLVKGKPTFGDALDQQQWIVNKSVAGYYSGIKLARGTGNNANTANNQHTIWVSDSGLNFGKTTDPGTNSFIGVSTHLTLNGSGDATFTGNVIAPSFVGRLQGAVTGAPDATIWCVSGQYTDWGIFYDEGNPDKILFKSSGNIKASIALDTGDMTGGTAVFSGDVTAFSDERLKDNVKTIDGALDKISNLRGVSYNRNDIDDKSKKIGVIAQEVNEVVPEVVNYNEDNDKYSVAYGNMAGLFIEAIKELKAEVTDLKKEIQTLKSK
jgi:hypothetical protein